MIISALLSATLVLSSAAPAFAAPSKADKLAQARQVKAQIDGLDRQVEIAAERYNVARDKHTKLVVERDRAAAKEKKALKRQTHIQGQLAGRADQMYRTGPMQFIEVLFAARSFDEFSTTWDVLREVNKQDAERVVELKQVKAEAMAARKELTVKSRQAADQVAVMASNKRSIEGKLASRQSKLRGIEAEIKDIERREEAAARAAARAAANSGSSGGGGDSYPAPSIPANGDVVSYAKSRLGCPYVWGAAGPSTFDCSGLTMWAYARVGISLPHSSQAQINSGQRVSRRDIQPGDLVFFGSPIHHVGMYIGGGMMIHAPHSGDVVKISPAFRGDYVGACRPG